MRPSGRLFLDPNAVYNNRRALHRAKWLVEDVGADVDSALELGHFREAGSPRPADVRVGVASAAERGDPAVPSVPRRRFPGRLLRSASREGPKIRPFPGVWRKDPVTKEELTRAWRLVAGVAEGHPRLLVWLAEGQVSWYWNVFGGWIAVLRVIPGLRRMMWRLLFKPVARRAPWRLELQEAILQETRYKINNGPRGARLSTALTITETPGSAQ